ncbi:MAG: hypothetical protein FJ399_04415 [Verrucomicrobia bacterium]|nr:hypothetical protein [Verrucomicrobiota bacterium]
MSTPRPLRRRRFLGGLFAVAPAFALARAQAAPGARPAFTATGREFSFDTGNLRGTLRAGGQSKGLIPVFDTASGAPLARSYGWFSPYRLLDDTTRYGDAAWSWASTAELQADGSVKVNWVADAGHPFDLEAHYRWSSARGLDFSLRVTARRALRRFEVFLASYFEGFPTTGVQAGSPAGFVGAPRTAGDWQMFPRDEAAVKIIQDGRWKHPPSPVQWSIRPSFAAPLAIRRDAAKGLAAVLMTRPEECFAVAAPYDEEVHRSVYFALFGRDLRAAESAATSARLVVAPRISDEQAIGRYREFLQEVRK